MQYSRSYKKTDSCRFLHRMLVKVRWHVLFILSKVLTCMTSMACKYYRCKKSDSVILWEVNVREKIHFQSWTRRLVFMWPTTFPSGRCGHGGHRSLPPETENPVPGEWKVLPKPQSGARKGVDHLWMFQILSLLGWVIWGGRLNKEPYFLKQQ